MLLEAPWRESTELDRRILNRLQDGLPLSETPYADVAAELQTDEATLLERVQALFDAGLLTRLGPLFRIDRAGGYVELAAMKVPDTAFETVVQQLDAIPEVAHNYARTHALNMWFVLAGESRAAVDAVVANIESQTGLSVLRFPKEREFFVDLRFYV